MLDSKTFGLLNKPPKHLHISEIRRRIIKTTEREDLYYSCCLSDSEEKSYSGVGPTIIDAINNAVREVTSERNRLQVELDSL